MMIVTWLLTRLKEPSTYAGLSGMALALGVSSEIYSAAAVALAGLAGLLSVVMAERLR